MAQDRRDQAFTNIRAVISSRNAGMRESVPTAPGLPTARALFSDERVGMAFMVVEPDAPLPDEPERLRPLIEACRAACTDALRPSSVNANAGMHVVILHGGELSSSDMEGLVDRYGQLATYCVSVTLVDYVSEQTEQDTFWPPQLIGRLEFADRSRINGALAVLRGNPLASPQTSVGQAGQTQVAQGRGQRTQRRQPSAVSVSPSKISWTDAFIRVFLAFATVYGAGLGCLIGGALLIAIGRLNSELLGGLLILTGWIAIVFGAYPAGLKVLTESISFSILGGRVREMPWTDAIFRSIMVVFGVFLSVYLAATVVAVAIIPISAAVNVAGSVSGTIGGIIGGLLIAALFFAGILSFFASLAAVILKILTDSILAYTGVDEVRGMAWPDAFRRVFRGVRDLIGIVALVLIAGIVIGIALRLIVEQFSDLVFDIRFRIPIDIPFVGRIPFIELMYFMIIAVIYALAPVAAFLKVLTDSIVEHVSDGGASTMSWKDAFLRVLTGFLVLIGFIVLGWMCLLISANIVKDFFTWGSDPGTMEVLLAAIFFLAGIFCIITSYPAVMLKVITDSVYDSLSNR